MHFETRVLDIASHTTLRDVPLSYELLADEVPAAKSTQQRISSMDYSASVIAYNLCLDVETPLLQHNVFVSSRCCLLTPKQGTIPHSRP